MSIAPSHHHSTHPPPPPPPLIPPRVSSRGSSSFFSCSALRSVICCAISRIGLPSAWALFAIFLPSWLLIAGALPFWHQLRAKAWMQAALRGANAAVVGILLSALYSPVITEGVKSARDVAVAFVAFGLLESWKVPPWAVVLITAAAGHWVLR